MSSSKSGVVFSYDDIWLIDGVRTPFADYNGVFGRVSPIDLGIKAARGVFARTGIKPTEVGSVVAGSMAQASFDAYVLPRHVSIYAGVPLNVPAILVQRVCGTGMEVLLQLSDAITLGKIQLGLGVGAESMSRNPIASYTLRGGMTLGRPEFGDFLVESLTDTAFGGSMGDTAERLAVEYKLSRDDVDRFALSSFERALAAQQSGFLAGEIVPVSTETFELEGYKPRGIKLPREVKELAVDTHVRPSPLETLAKIRPAFGGVQTGGNSSAIVDGAAAALVASGAYCRDRKIAPLARISCGAVVGVPPDNMGIGPAVAIRALLDARGLKLSDIDRFEINEAFGAQCLAVERELGIDHAKLNPNGGAIAIGHPLAASGLRLSITVARELRRSKTRYGISSACIGGGQGIAVLIENPDLV